MSLRTRIAFVVAASVAVAVLAISGILLFAARSQARSALDQTLIDRAELVPSAAASLPSRGRGDRIFGRFVPDDVLLQVIDSGGEVIIGNVEGLPVSDESVELARGGASNRRHFEDVEVEGVRLRVLTVSFPNRQALMVAKPLAEIDDTVGRLRTVVWFVAVLGVAGAGVVGFLVAGRAIRPVRRLTHAAAAVAETQDFDHPIEVERADELGELASSFNAMLEALDESRQQQHRLVTDASHELRTPLTSLRTNIELMQRAPHLPETERMLVMDDVLFELDELTALVSELVELATDRHSLGDPEELDLAVVTDAVVRRHRRRTDCEIAAVLTPTRVRVVPALLERAVSNLVDNAIKWSPAGGVVEVTVDEGEVRVRDHGPGIPEAEREKVFERFYRAESARSAPGSGLGLAIVKHVADNFGGEALVVPTEGPGTTVVLRFPEISPASEEAPVPVGV